MSGTGALTLLPISLWRASGQASSRAVIPIAGRADFVVNMFERHREHPDEQEVFFVAVQRPKVGRTSGSVLLLGAPFAVGEGGF
jgi:hypothetical protein